MSNYTKESQSYASGHRKEAGQYPNGSSNTGHHYGRNQNHSTRIPLAGGVNGIHQRNSSGMLLSSPSPLRESPVWSGYKDTKKQWGCRTVDCFDRIELIGKGAYGEVWKMRDIKTNEICALKSFNMEHDEKEGFALTSIREIKILKALDVDKSDNNHIVRMKEVVYGEDEGGKAGMKFYMVMEYLDHDLSGLVSKIKLEEKHVKTYLNQLLKGIRFLHLNKILHRDIKPSNLLIDKNGMLKIADFGLARSFGEKEQVLTTRVCTLWYRPPELLLGATKYKGEIDMWSVGCILGELLKRRALCPGSTEIEQLDLIWRLCGVPTKESWPEADSLPGMRKIPFKTPYKRKVREFFKEFSDETVNFMDRFLALDPAKRITPLAALEDPYFSSQPFPCELSELPKPHESLHEFQLKEKSLQRKRKAEEAQMAQNSQMYPHKQRYHNAQDNRYRDRQHPPQVPNYHHQPPPQYHRSGQAASYGHKGPRPHAQQHGYNQGQRQRYDSQFSHDYKDQKKTRPDQFYGGGGSGSGSGAVHGINPATAGSAQRPANPSNVSRFRRQGLPPSSSAAQAARQANEMLGKNKRFG